MLSVVDNAGGTPQSVALAGTGMDFTLAISPGTATLTAGQSVTVNVVVSPVGGLNQAVTLGCTGAPAAAACSVSPANLTLNGSGASTASVSLTTSARSLLPISFRSPRPPALPLMLIAVFIVMAMMVWKTRASRRLIQCFGFSVLVVLLTGGCAGVVAKNPSPSPGGGTPAGNYALNITATLSGIAHSATFTLNVQ
jgi:hypothetical protein